MGNALNSNLGNILNASAACGLGAYLIAVTVQGNLLPNDQKADLVDYVVSDADYIEFVVAMVAIWALLQWGPSKEFVGPIVVVGVLGVLLKAGASNQLLLSALADFGKPQFLQELLQSLGVQ